MPTSPPEEAARNQDAAASRLLVPTEVAVRAALAGETTPPSTLDTAVEFAVYSTMIATLSSLLRQPGVEPADYAKPTVERIQIRAEKATPTVRDNVWQAARGHAANADGPLANYTTERKYVQSVARTAATRTAALSVLELADELGFGYKLWLTRGDSRVRDLHRKLHGTPTPIGKPFRKWPTGQELNYPGDPSAPMDAWINCRCFLWAVPSPEGVREAFAPADLDRAFALAASLEREWFHGR